jgi:phage terminase large subunit-like protein
MLVHGEGDLLGKPYRVPAWLRRAAYRILEYDPTIVDPTTGAHPYLTRRTLIICPKGSAKTEGVAALALFLLAGPSMPTPNGPMQRRSPNMPMAAGSWDQANKLFGAAATNMATGTPDSPAPLAAHVECFDSEIQLRDAPGKIYRVAAVAGTNDGDLPTAAFCDEIHEWTGRKRRVHLVLTQGLEKRFNGLEVNITTPDAADPDSLLGTMYRHAERVAAGELEDPELYYLRYGAPEGTKVATVKQLAAALRKAHPAEWIDCSGLAARLISRKIPAHEIRRYWLAQFVPAAGHWLPDGAWEQRLRQGRTPRAGTEIVVAFDGSYRRDSTAVVGCTLKGHLFVIDAWERPEGAGDSWRVPRSEVKAVVAAAMDRWDVRELAPDPPGWHDEIEGWEETWGDTVVRYDTNERRRMAAACSRFYAAVAGGEEDASALPLTHDGDPRLARHLRNAVPKSTPAGTLITKATVDSKLKIDIAIAAVVAFDRASWHARHEATEPEIAVAGVWA